MSRTTVKKSIGIMLFTVLFSLGWILADAVTKPLEVSLNSHIKIFKQKNTGGWEQIDEVGPANLNFTASLSDLAASKKATTSFVWNAKTKNGYDYSVRLAAPVDLRYNPANGQLDGDFPFQITYRGKSARVAGKLTTETIPWPVETLRGQRAKGIFGINPSELIFVSANDLQIPGEAPLKLVCREQYRITPKK